MDVVLPYTVNETQFNKKLLIATQGSDFKNQVTRAIVDHYKADSVYIQVIAIEELEDVDPKDFDALVVIHTWEYGKPPPAVKEFINGSKPFNNKLVMLTTSGAGTYKMEAIDAIAGESILDEVSVFVDKVVGRLSPLLMTN